MTLTKQSKPRVLLVNDATEVPQDYVDHIGTLCERTVIQQAPHDVLATRIKEAIQENGPFVGMSHTRTSLMRSHTLSMHRVPALGRNMAVAARRAPRPPTHRERLSPILLWRRWVRFCPFHHPPTPVHTPLTPSPQVDIQYLTRNKVYYANTALSASVRTADSAAMMILQVIRSASKREHDARAGVWQDRTLRAKDARKSVLGIVGMGSIGKLVKDHMQHFGMYVPVVPASSTD